MIDLLDPALHARPDVVETLCELRREHGPIVWTPGRRGPGYWSILGHPELVEIGRDPETFSSFSGTRPEVYRSAEARRPLHNLDPPEHGALRTLAGRALHGDRLDAFDATLDNAIAAVVDHTGDVVPVVEHLVARVFTHWLGFRVDPAELLERAITVHSAGAALLDTARDDAAWTTRVTAARDASDAIARLVADELAHARDGTVLHALRDATPEALRLGVLFVEAGLPASIDALTSAIADLAAHPVTIPADPSLLVEELLRRASPVAQFARRATRDVRRIKQGHQVVMWFVAANHDERVFEAPFSLDPRRQTNPHVAFGSGPHRCIGALLGRRVLRAMVLGLRDRRIVVTGAERRASSYLRGFDRLDVAICAPPANQV